MGLAETIFVCQSQSPCPDFLILGCTHTLHRIHYVQVNDQVSVQCYYLLSNTGR